MPEELDVIVGEIADQSYIGLDDGTIVATIIFKKPAHVRHSVDESSEDIAVEVGVIIDNYRNDLEVE